MALLSSLKGLEYSYDTIFPALKRWAIVREHKARHKPVPNRLLLDQSLSARSNGEARVAALRSLVTGRECYQFARGCAGDCRSGFAVRSSGDLCLATIANNPSRGGGPLRQCASLPERARTSDSIDQALPGASGSRLIAGIPNDADVRSDRGNPRGDHSLARTC